MVPYFYFLNWWLYFNSNEKCDTWKLFSICDESQDGKKTAIKSLLIFLTESF